METWISLPEYEGLYEISDEGRVRSVYRGRCRPCKLQRDNGGYLLARLSCPGHKCMRKVHRLVLRAFVGPCPPGHEGAHLNGVRTDNRLSNLRWATKAENMVHRDAHGTTAKGDRHGMRIHVGLVRGEKNGKARLKESDVIEVRRLASLGFTHLRIAGRFGLKESAVWKIVNRRTWRHVEEGILAEKAVAA